MSTSSLAKHVWKVLFVAIAGFYLYGLGALPLVGPDEPRYAQVAREMLMRRDLITPTLGGVPWFEKPPLLYWLMMASYRLFGVSEYAARLGPALCGLLTAAFVFWTGARVERSEASRRISEHDRGILSNRLGTWSTLAFLSSLGVIAFSRGASSDIVLTMTVTGALCCFLVFQISGAEAKPSLLIGFYAFIGLSLLAKGLVGFILTLGVIASYFVIRRERPTRRFLLSLIWGVPVAVIIAGVWYGPMVYRHGWIFIDQFIVQHHFARFLSNKYHHPQPFYFYVPILALLVLPWTIVLIAAALGARRWQWRGNQPLDRLVVFAGAWLVFTLLFFSFSQSKIPGYVLPVLPAASLLIGERIRWFVRVNRGHQVIRLTGALLTFGAGFGAWYSVRALAVPIPLVITTSILVGIVGLFAMAAPRYQSLLFLLFGILPIVVSALALRPAADVANRESVRDLMQTANVRGYSETPVYYLLADDRTAEFYAGGRLAYQPNGEPIRFEGAQDVAATIREKGGTGLVLIETRWERQLTKYSPGPTERVGSNGSLSLFVVRVP